MKTKISFSLFLLSIQLIFAQQITGSWKGELDFDGTKLPIIINIEKDKDSYKALLDSPAQGAEGIPAEKTSFLNNELTLEISSANASYKGKLEGNKISGSFIQNGKAIPLILQSYDKKNNTDEKLEVLKLTGNLQEGLNKIDDFISYLEKNNAEAGEISIFKEGKEVYKRTFGEASLSQKGKTTFQIGSITKSMTAMMLFKLIEKKELNLNDKLSKFYPKIPNAEKITISQLLHHSSGLGDYVVGKNTMKWLTEKVSEEQIMNHIIEQGSLFEPGTKVQYSNSGYYLLTKILEKISKKSYADNLKETFVQPLQLKDFYTVSQKPANVFSSYNYANTWESVKDFDFNNVVGVGDIATTPTNLNIILNALFAGKIVSKESLSAMMPREDRFGMGLALVPFYSKMFVGHSGGTYGTNSLMIYNGEDDISISYSLNADRIGANNFVIDIFSIFYNKEFSLPTFSTTTITETELKQYVGDYSSKDLPLGIKIYIKNGGLFAQGTGQPEFPLEYVEKNQFKFDNAGLKMTFFPEKEEMQLEQGGGNFLFNKKK
ncbi:serine hydrolase domain-containing protein [Chryseobacterium gwangjuense]|uniref:serine hydrolase domain-containing protein n=1 Tax=Chryseobacterium gwangjuense TaxID=1069980 RepID=UPI001E6245D2|nr:serine hydrolase domain-containing protein [Chryseobacterium gwangjuense]MCE3075864.1 beta-lactamase family protein [Chryseobacterium gwangjuense]